MRTFRKNMFFITALLVISACSLDPVVKDNIDTDINTIDDIKTFIDGAYAYLKNDKYWGRNMIVVGEVRADNVDVNGNTNRFMEWSRMEILPTEKHTDNLMTYIYSSVANPNIIINTDFEAIEGENDEDKDHLIGEAYAIRAMAHFDLLRVFGQVYSEGQDLGISYIKTFKADDTNIPRGSVEENKKQLYKDITSAIDYLKLGKKSELEDSELRFTLDGVYALKSRIGIYFKDYSFALEGSAPIVDKYNITPAEDYVNYWKEPTPGPASIFELALSSDDNNGTSNIANIYRTEGYGDIDAFPDLIEDIGFDKKDIRSSSAMIDYDTQNNRPNDLKNFGKYTDINGADNIKVFRIEEIVLNHAEALLMNKQSDEKEALKYLNKIPENREAKTYKADSQQKILNHILEERRKELLFEGFRFFDLARHGLDIPALESSNPYGHELIPAGDYRLALPIPQHEINSNNKTTQNSGY